MKNIPLNIKILFVIVIASLIAIGLPDSSFKWVILGLLLVSYPFIVVYFVAAGIKSVVKSIRQQAKEFKQYYNEFELTDVSLKKGILSLTVIQRTTNE